MATIQACFGRCGLHTEQGDKRSTAGATQESELLSVLEYPTFVDLADRTRSAT